MNTSNNENDIKKFLIKLVAIVISIIIIINVSYNLILSDKMEKLNIIFSLDQKENREQVKDKIRSEINKSLEKDKILSNEDKILILKFLEKIKKEFKEIEQN